MPITPVEVKVPNYLPEVGEFVAAYEMTADEFLDWEHEGFAEWVDGRAYQYMTVTPAHQIVVQFLAWLLKGFLDVDGEGGLVLSGPAAVRLTPGGRLREPDLLFVREQHIGRVTDRLVEGVPDLVVEVISRDSTSRDRGAKFEEYQSAGVPEYWIIDPRPQVPRADFYVLRQTSAGVGRYEAMPLTEGIYRSQVVNGFWFNPDWLSEEQPNAMAHLIEIVGMERIQRMGGNQG